MPDTPPRPPRPPGTLRVGTIAGSDVLVSSSWFVVAGLIAFIVAPVVEEVEPGLGAWRYVAGFAFAVILYLSVLLHEASHAYMARHYGFPVSSITLHFLGGMTAIEGEARTPRQEFFIAVVGPLTSLAIGGAALALWPITPHGLLLMAVGGLAGANLLVGILNLVPGLPLDGGRVLKAGVWALTGDVHRGTIVAGWIGRVAAVVVLCWPFAMGPLRDRELDVLDLVFAVIIALFLWSGSTSAMASARFRSRIPDLVARELARRTLAVPGDLPLAEAVRRAQDAEAGSILTVTSSGEPVGIVSEAAVHATPEERRPWVATSTVSRTLIDELRLPADIRGEDLVMAISRTPSDEYLLIEPDGSIVGVLSTGDVDRAFPELGALGSRAVSEQSPDVPAEAWSGVHRGPLREGEWIRLVDQKGRRHNFELVAGKRFFSNRGHLEHDDMIGREEGFTLVSSAGGEYLCFRPLLSEFVVSMPRGAAVVYPKDAAQIVALADIFPGAHVVEAGVGSGALTCSLLRAVGPYGRVSSFERREEFADVARRNVNQFFGAPVGETHPAWQLTLGDLAEALPASGERADRVILDMLAPWECLDATADALRPGGIVCAYVATTTQLSRFVETVRVHGGFTEPQAWESLVRDWHVEGLAVRPGHKMIGHTAFLVTARRMAPGERPPLKRRRPAPGAYGPDYTGPRPPGEPAVEPAVEPVEEPLD